MRMDFMEQDSIRVYIASCKHEGVLAEFETVTKTRDAVEGLHNFREFSQTPGCLDEAI